MGRVSGNGDTGEDNITISLGRSHLDKFTLGQYVVCKYDIDRWIANIKEPSFEMETHYFRSCTLKILREIFIDQ